MLESGYGSEIDWQQSVAVSCITETDFLSQSAWVVLSAGMKESIIRLKFEAFSRAFFYWSNAHIIVRNQARCKRAAMEVFRNERKIFSILKIAEEVECKGFDAIRNLVASMGVEYIRTLPFMGPITSLHLAKNLGLSVVKPDRHLVRIAENVGYSQPAEMCQAIAEVVGDDISVVDLVIWRFATLNRNYLRIFSSHANNEWSDIN